MFSNCVIAALKGLRGRTRLTWEWLLAWGALFWLSHHADASIGMSWSVPFFKDVSIHWGALGLPLTALCVVVGCANAVNLTDGLDGLAVVPAMIAFSCFFVIAWIVGNHVFASYLHLPYVPQTGELAVLCAAMLGAGLGFLWFNAPPAQIFMGDMGALAIGGLLGFVAVATHHELVLAIAGGTLSCGDIVRHGASSGIQNHGQAGFFDGAAASSL